VSISKLPDGRYQWRDRDANRRQRKKTFSTLREAKDHAAAFRADINRGTYVDQSDKTITADWVERWASMRTIRESTRIQYANLVNVHLRPLPLGSMPLVKVRTSHVQAWVNDRAERLSPYVLRIRVSVLRSAFAAAVEDGLISRNPVPVARRLSMPEDDRAPVVPLTGEQVAAWAAAFPDWARAAVLTQAATGMRMSELRGLRKRDVDFGRGVITVSGQLSRETSERVPVKNSRRRGASTREIPMHPALGKILAAQMLAWPPDGPDGPVFPGRPYATTVTKTAPRSRERYQVRLREAERFGPQRTRQVPGTWDHRRMTEIYRQAMTTAGITLPRHQVTHALRHFFASAHLADGVDLVRVSSWMGDTAEVVLSTYAHLMGDPAAMASARGAIGIALGAARDSRVAGVD
jgi:integrase